jgi:hypothetical protein
VLYTNDAGNTWQKLERVTPEHLISVQFNAFDDYYYFTGGLEFAAESVYFEDGGEMRMPFGNGIATGAVMYDWMAYTGQCGFGSPNDGQACTRSYNCRKPELSVVLRTNCGGTLTSTRSKSRRPRRAPPPAARPRPRKRAVGAAWSPSVLPLLAARLARAGFRATAGRPADAFGGVWQHWHGDLLTGGRGEIFHRLGG